MTTDTNGESVDLTVAVSEGGVKLMLGAGRPTLAFTVEQARMLGRDLIKSADQSEDLANGGDLSGQRDDAGDAEVASSGELREQFEKVFGEPAPPLATDEQLRGVLEEHAHLSKQPICG